MKEKGSDWHYMATRVEGPRAGLHCLSKATAQSLSPPRPRVTLSNNKKTEQKPKDKER